MAQELHLYNVTLQKGGAHVSSVYGNFSDAKAQEIVVSRGTSIELLRPDDETGKMQSILIQDCYAVVRTLLPFRLMGSKIDYLVVGSDSGRIVILEYNTKLNKFQQVHQETYGKTGCRRIVPGQYLAADPSGRALMIGAVEKQKFVYILNRDAAEKLTISSPLEAHKSNRIVFDICGVDCGLENPQFASLEVDYHQTVPQEQKIASKMLVFYEMDLGSNHVKRAHAQETDPSANLLIAVPGGAEGPGGVLVCAQGSMTYSRQEHDDITVPLPRRLGTADESKPVMIVSHATHRQRGTSRQRALFFFLVQTEYGDIFKVTLDYVDSIVSNVHIKYFDTVPVTVSMCVLKTGFLFCSSEFSNHYLFQFQGIGNDDDVETNVSTPAATIVHFKPRELVNLVLIDEIESLSPVLDSKVVDLCKEGAPQIYTLCGRGARSSLRILRHGLAVAELAAPELPSNPSAVWAVKKHTDDETHAYIVVSFVNATIVLSIGDTVSEVSDSGLMTDTQSLSVSTFGENTILQIHPEGLHHVEANGRVNKWNTAAKRTITQCAVNQTQAVIALSGGELRVFELDRGQLTDTCSKDMGNDVASLALAPVPENRRRAQYLAVGGFDNTVRILSMDLKEPLRQVSMQAIPALPHSLAIASMITGHGGSADTKSLYLFVGLHTGVLVRSSLDEGDGSVSDTRQRFVGTKNVNLHKVHVNGQTAVVALSSRPWMCYAHRGAIETTPLSYEAMDCISSFVSEQCPEGLIGITGNTLRVIALEALGQLFNESVVPLRYTPRRMVVHPQSQFVVLIETDDNTYPYVQRRKLLQRVADADPNTDEKFDRGIKRARVSAAGAGDQDMDMDVDSTGEAALDGNWNDEEILERDAAEAFIGVPTPGVGTWASCIRIVNPTTGETVLVKEFENNEAAFSAAIVRFPEKSTDTFLAVGVVRDLVMAPRSMSGASIRMFKFVNGANGSLGLELFHDTPMDDVPLALTPFQDQLLAGVGNYLRLYDLGKRTLLRKCENKNFPTTIARLHTSGSRIYVGDTCEAFHFVKYRKEERQFHVFADNANPRYITASCMVDYDTMAAGDKFGNIFVSRLPGDADEDLVDHMSTGTFGNTMVSDAPNKLFDINQYHVGEMVTAIHKTSLVPGGQDVLFYTTLMGTLGMLVPVVSREDLEILTHLEMHMRQANVSLCGRDHLAYRSYYFPVKDVVDGDLCKEFNALDDSAKHEIGEELVRTKDEIAKKLEELRDAVM
jgi:splicing factor 3B subunit 3